MSVKSLILPFLLGALLGGGIAWLLIHDAPSGVADDQTDRAGAAVPGATGEAGSAPDAASDTFADAELVGSSGAAAHLEELRRANQGLKTEVAQLQEQVESLQPKPRDPRAFRFGVPTQAKSFSQAKWDELASNMMILTEKISELKDKIVGGGNPTLAEQLALQKYNAPLATFAGAFGADMEDPNPNGAYTHPAVVANMMRAALVAADLPLTEEQEIAIQALGNAWIGEQDRADAAWPTNAPMLKKTAASVDSKLRFLASAKSVLTDAQRDVLWLPEREGRLKLDLLSPALAYILSFPVTGSDRAELEKKAIGTLFEHAGITVEDAESYAWIGREWIDAIPSASEPISERSLDLIFPHVDLIQTRARAQVAAIDRVLAMGGLTSEQEADLRALNTLLHPYIPLL